jgi:hypothetical protein
MFINGIGCFKLRPPEPAPYNIYDEAAVVKLRDPQRVSLGIIFKKPPWFGRLF